MPSPTPGPDCAPSLRAGSRFDGSLRMLASSILAAVGGVWFVIAPALHPLWPSQSSGANGRRNEWHGNLGAVQRAVVTGLSLWDRRADRAHRRLRARPAHTGPADPRSRLHGASRIRQCRRPTEASLVDAPGERASAKVCAGHVVQHPPVIDPGGLVELPGCDPFGHALNLRPACQLPR